MSACYLFSSLYARSLFYNLLRRLLRRPFALQMDDNACDIYIVRRSAHLCKLAYDTYIVRRSAHPRGSFLCNRNKVSYLHKNRGHAMHDLFAISLFRLLQCFLQLLINFIILRVVCLQTRSVQCLWHTVGSVFFIFRNHMEDQSVTVILAVKIIDRIR